MANNSDTTDSSNGANQPLFDMDDKKQRNVLYSILWLLLALFIVLPLAYFLAPFWFFLQLIEPLLPVSKLAFWNLEPQLKKDANCNNHT